MEGNGNGNLLRKVVSYWPLIAALAGFIAGWSILNEKVSAQGREVGEATKINGIQTSEIAVLQEQMLSIREMFKEIRDEQRSTNRELRGGRRSELLDSEKVEVLAANDGPETR